MFERPKTVLALDRSAIEIGEAEFYCSRISVYLHFKRRKKKIVWEVGKVTCPGKGFSLLCHLL
jgi:hypothetical protein